MSDDEYFDNDEIFTSSELDNIPFLNESSGTDVVAPSPAPAPAPKPPTPQRPLPPPIRSSSNRLNTIMNALRSARDGQGSSQSAPRSGGSVLGTSTGLLNMPQDSPSQRPHPRKRDSSSGSDMASGSKSPRKRTRRASLRLQQCQSSSPSLSNELVEKAAQRNLLEGETKGKASVWGIVEEELCCAICYDVFVAPQITTCGHTVCAPCLKPWLASHSTCPMCRTRLNSSQKPIDNLFCASMVDRLLREHSDWQASMPKRIEWDKKKQAWDQELARSRPRPRRSVPPRTVQTRAQSRRPLFMPDEDSESDSDSDDSDSWDAIQADLAINDALIDAMF